MLSLAFECAGQGLSAALAAEGKLIGTTAQQMDRGLKGPIVIHPKAPREGAEVNPSCA